MFKLDDFYFGNIDDSDRIQLAGEQLQHLQKIVIRMDYLEGNADGRLTATTQKVCENFMGNENFEERCDL